MKTSLKALILSAALVAPVIAFAQPQSPVTRAQLRAELVDLESVGYQPSTVDPMYPAGLEAAEAKLAAKREAQSVGGAQSGTSQGGGSSVSKSDWDAMYTR